MIKQSIELIPLVNQKLELFKSSIDTLIKQNDEYMRSVQRYAEKSYEIHTNKRETEEEKKNRLETMLDQLDDIKKRIELTLTEITDFMIKFDDFDK